MRRFFMGGILAGLLFVLAGCEKPPQETIATPAPTVSAGIKTMTIYSVNADTMTLIPVSVRRAGQTDSAYSIVSLVVDSLNDGDIYVKRVTTKENGSVIVSFSSKGKPVKGCGKKMERLILDSIANSRIDNVDGCDKVIFRCDGKRYRSAHYQFGLHEVYASE